MARVAHVLVVGIAVALLSAACGGVPETRCSSLAACGPTAVCTMGACTRHELVSTAVDARRVIVHPRSWATLEEPTGGRAATRADTMRVGGGATSLLRFRAPDLGGARSIVGAWLELSPDVAGPASIPRGELVVRAIDRPWRASRVVARTAPGSAGVALAVAPVDVRRARVRVDLLSAVSGLLRGTTATRGFVLSRRESGASWEFASPSASDVASRPRLVLLVR